MSVNKTIKGSTSAKIAGVLICFYGFIIFATSILVSDTFNITTFILIIMSSLAMIIGIGLINLHYYAWVTAIVLCVFIVLSGGINLILILLNSQGEDSSSFAAQLFWQVIFFWLLYASRHACRAKKGQSVNFVDTIKHHSPVLAATTLTVITIFIIKAYKPGAFFILVFPLLIIEFVVFYFVGQKMQKKYGWDVINTSTITTDETPQSNTTDAKSSEVD